MSKSRAYEDQTTFGNPTPEDNRRMKRFLTRRRERAEPDYEGPDYEGFVRDVRAMGINVQDFNADSAIKDELLRCYFPGRYQFQGWGEWEDGKRGALFKKMYEDSQKRF